MSGLLLLGASIRAAAQSAARAGFHVVGGDLFADRDARRVADCHVVDDYPDGLLQLRARFPELPVAITGALENHPEMLDAFADRGDYWGNSAAVVRRIRDPFELQRFCELSGIPFPQTAKTCPRDPSRTWIQKAFSSAGGQRIGHELQQLDSPGYFQEYVDGEVCSAAYIGSQGKATLLGVTNMLVGCDWLGAKDFLYCGSICRAPSAVERLQWNHVGEVLAREFQLVGAFGIDAIARNHEIVLLEVNPRYTASMELFENSGPSIMAQHVAAIHGTPLSPAVDFSHCSGKAILYAQQSVVIDDHIEQLQPPRVQFCDVPHAGLITKGQPILTIKCNGVDAVEVKTKLKKATASVYQHLRSTE